MTINWKTYIFFLLIISILFNHFNWSEQGDNLVNFGSSKSGHKPEDFIEPVNLHESNRKPTFSPANSLIGEKERLNKEFRYNTKITRQEFNNAIENSSVCLNDRGYFLLDQFIESEENRNEYIANDYNTYTIEQLRLLANNNDPQAQMYLGLTTLQSDFEEAEKWLKRSIITGNYTSVISSIIDSAQTKIDVLKTTEKTSISNQSIDFDTDKLKEKIYTWSLVSLKLSDPFAHANLNSTYTGINLSRDRINVCEKESKRVYRELSQQRQVIGIDKFSEEKINPQDFKILSNYNGD